MKENPEDTCQECKGPNIVWFTYNTLWNKIVDSKPAILCPICFAKGAEEKGVRPSSWYLTDKGDGQGELLAEAYQKLYEANERIAKLEAPFRLYASYWKIERR